MSEILISLSVLALLGASFTLALVSVRFIVMWWLLAAMVVPAWVVNDWMTLYPHTQTLRTASAVSAGFLAMIVVGRLLPVVSMRGPILKPSQVRSIVLWVLGGSLVVAIAVVGAPAVGDFSLDTIYARRADFKVAATGSVAAYIVVWMGQILAPLALVVGMRYGRRLLTAMAIGAAGFVYAMTGAKSAPMILAVAALLYWLTGKRVSALPWRWPLVVVSVSLVPVLIRLLTGWDYPLYLITRRFSLLTSVDAVGQALLGAESGSQIDSVKSLVMAVTGQLSDGVARGSLAVGQLIRPGSGNNANSHFLSFSLQWLSPLPTLIVAALGVTLLWLFDVFGSTKDFRLAVPFGGTVCLSLSEFYLHTALVTGGVTLALLLVWLLPAAEEDEVVMPTGHELQTINALTSLRDPTLQSPQ